MGDTRKSNTVKRRIDGFRQFPYDISKREVVRKVQRIGLTVFIVKGGWNE
jgi:hypothetical protein